MAVYSTLNLPKLDAANMSAKADVQVVNLLAYKTALTAYLAANPSATGNIVDASITMPTGMVRNSNYTNNVVNGVLYVYEITPSNTNGALDLLNSKTKGSILAGKKVGTSLVNSKGYSTGITLPVVTPVIPAGSIVLVGS